MGTTPLHHARQGAGGLCRLACREEGFTDQDGIYAGLAQLPHFTPVTDPALRDHDDVIWHLLDESRRRSEVGRERREVPIVDPDDGGAHANGPRQFVRVVNLDQRTHTQGSGLSVQRLESTIVEEARDEQNRIRARAPSFDDVQRIEREVFPEHRDFSGEPDRREVVEGTAEICRIREDTEGRRPCGFVAGRERHRVELRTDVTGTGRATFALRDQRYHAGPTERGPEIADRAGCREGSFERIRTFAKIRQLRPLGPHDRCEDSGKRVVFLRFGQLSGNLLRFLFGFPTVWSAGSMPLTKRQKEILDYIEVFIDDHGYAPSFEEIAESFGYSSLATVHEHLSNLERKGYIRKSYNESRSIELVGQQNGTPVLELPLLGAVAAGLPIEAIQDTETIAVPPDMVSRRRDNYVLRVEGNSMIEEQIRDGDYIVVQAQDNAEDGQMVVALVAGEAATVKKLYREEDGRVRLQPANPTMEPIFVDANDVRIQGVVVGVIRKY